MKASLPDGTDIFRVLNFATENRQDQIMREQAHSRVKQLLDLLPEEQKEVIVLRHYAELSFKEIADLTNVSINTALGRMRYGLINIRKMMAEKNIVL